MHVPSFMYQAYDSELLNQKESKTADSGLNSPSSGMHDTSQHPLYVATRRLVKALDQLEGNLKQALLDDERNLEQEERLGHVQRENLALKQERESLNNAIAGLQRQYNDLHKTAAHVYGKLDDSVKRLTQLIEE